MQLGMHTYSLYHHGVAEDWAGFSLPWPRQMDNRLNIEPDLRCPLDDMHQALRIEREALQRSIRWCRAVLGIARTDRGL